MTNKLDSIKLEHNSYISLHVQIHNQLRQNIISKRWKHGERIPTEAQLSKHLDISRTTVRIALQRAEVEGLIRRTAGRGTFVTYETPENTSSRLIGYVTRSFDNEIHRLHLNSVETELRSAGYRVIFSNANTSDEEVSILEQLLEDNIEAVMLYPHAESTQAQKDILGRYISQNIPVVFLDRIVDGIDLDYVSSDNFTGGYSVVNHLIELGHEHIVFLQPNINGLLPIDDRYRGYFNALEEHGLPVYDPWFINSSDGYEFFEADIFNAVLEEKSTLIEDVLKNLNNAEPRPTAIFCVNDSLALITLLAIQKIGLKVPDDMSIAGFDDISLASYMSVPLTTVAQNAYELGRVGAQILIERLEGDTSPPIRQMIPTRIQIRMSTSTPPVKVADDSSIKERSEYRED
jgi:GntR family transcriptional regulator, arabinose operon transcriptional repressor